METPDISLAKCLFRRRLKSPAPLTPWPPQILTSPEAAIQRFRTEWTAESGSIFRFRVSLLSPDW